MVFFGIEYELGDEFYCEKWYINKVYDNKCWVDYCFIFGDYWNYWVGGSGDVWLVDWVVLRFVDSGKCK